MAAGRPTAFKPEFVEQAERLCKLGATDQEIADFFNVSVRTLQRWKSENEQFCHSIKTGKEVADERVERSLFSRALGYEHEEIDIRVVDHSIVQTPVRKYYPPDTTAAIFWLKNRRGHAWRDVKEVKMTRDLKEMTDAELHEIASGSGDTAQASGTQESAKLH